MQRITNATGIGENESGTAFEAVVLTDETGAQYQLFVSAGQLSLVKLEPCEEAVDEEVDFEEETEELDADGADIDAQMESLLKAFGEVFGRCTNPKCACQG